MRVIALLLLICSACGSTPFSAPDAGMIDGSASDASTAIGYPAPHPPEATLVMNGGPQIVDPVFVAITFPNDPYVHQLESFLGALGGSEYWATLAGQYGIHAARAGAPIHLTEAAPAQLTDSDIGPWIASRFDGTHPEWGTPDPNIIYSLFYPKTTALTVAGAGLACVDNAGGIHDSVKVGNIEVIYSAVVECDIGLGGTEKLDSATFATSHELIEAATDPLGDGWYVDPDHYSILPFAGSGEIADLCEFSDSSLVAPGLPYTVTRAWSNAAVGAGTSPCVPSSGGEPYFNTAPVFSDQVAFTDFGVPLTTLGVKIPVGGSRTVQLELFSDAKTSGPWSVTARDAASLLGKPRTLSFSFDRATGENGDQLALTITALSQDPDFGAEPFLLISRLGTRTEYAFGMVGN